MSDHDIRATILDSNWKRLYEADQVGSSFKSESWTAARANKSQNRIHGVDGIEQGNKKKQKLDQ